MSRCCRRSPSARAEAWRARYRRRWQRDSIRPRASRTILSCADAAPAHMLRAGVELDPHILQRVLMRLPSRDRGEVLAADEQLLPVVDESVNRDLGGQWQLDRHGWKLAPRPEDLRHRAALLDREIPSQNRQVAYRFPSRKVLRQLVAP